MEALDPLAAVEVGNGACDAQQLIVAAGGEPEAVERALEEFFTRGVESAEFADHRRGHVGIAGDGRAGEALFLNVPRGVDALAHGGGGLRLFAAAHGLKLHRGDADL